MLNRTNKIFCDEAGFTGDNMKDPDQPYFVFSSVNITNEDAQLMIDHVYANFGIQGNELKGSKLVKHRAGQEAISYLLDRCENHLMLTINHKMFSLACRFFEWTFAEIFASNNSLLYENAFHRFVANSLYLGFITSEPATTTAFDSFQDYMRSRSTDLRLDGDGNAGGVRTVSLESVNSSILLFCELHKSKIGDVVERINDSEEPLKWVLDLSIPSLHSLLGAWADRIGSLDVYCDDSKPLKDRANYFTHLIGRTDEVRLNLGPISGRLVYNLENEIQFVDSHDNPSIQVADVFASALCYALANPENDFCRKLYERLVALINPQSIIPDPETYFNVDIHESRMNYLALMQMLELKLRGENISSQLEDIFHWANQAAEGEMINFDKEGG